MGLVMNELLVFSGVWRCRYWYPNTKHDNREEVSEYMVAIDHAGSGYGMHSLSKRGEAPGSQIEAHFTVDNTVVTGTFMESTAPSGDWEGMTYKGAFQLLLNEERTRMEGSWVAAGYNNGHPKTFTGRWELTLTDQS